MNLIVLSSYISTKVFGFRKFKGYSISLILFFFLLLAASCQQEHPPSESTNQKQLRIISLSGFLTETLYDLGYSENIVGRDVTSTYPQNVDTLPNLGHVTQLNLEAILQLQPDIIFLESNQMKQAQGLNSLGAAGIEIVHVPTTPTLDNARKAAQIIGAALSMDDKKLKTLAQQIEADSLKLATLLEQKTSTPKVLFIYARGAGRLMVAGKNTTAASIIEKAGGQNAIQSFEDFQALTPEALVEAAPEVILMFSTGLASLDGKAGLAQITGIPQTPAFQNDRIITMDGHYLTSFSSRASKAAYELATQLHQH